MEICFFQHKVSQMAPNKCVIFTFEGKQSQDTKINAISNSRLVEPMKFRIAVIKRYFKKGLEPGIHGQSQYIIRHKAFKIQLIQSKLSKNNFFSYPAMARKRRDLPRSHRQMAPWKRKPSSTVSFAKRRPPLIYSLLQLLRLPPPLS